MKIHQLEERYAIELRTEALALLEQLHYSEKNSETVSQDALLFLAGVRLAELRRLCKRKAVAAVAYEETDNVVKGKALTVIWGVSTNGPVINTVECSGEVGKCGCMHAEPDLIMNLKERRAPSDLVLVVTWSPCTGCANMIVRSSFFRKVVYGGITQHDTRGIEILEKSGIKCVNLDVVS